MTARVVLVCLLLSLANHSARSQQPPAAALGAAGGYVMSVAAVDRGSRVILNSCPPDTSAPFTAWLTARGIHEYVWVTVVFEPRPDAKPISFTEAVAADSVGVTYSFHNFRTLVPSGRPVRCSLIFDVPKGTRLVSLRIDQTSLTLPSPLRP